MDPALLAAAVAASPGTGLAGSAAGACVYIESSILDSSFLTPRPSLPPVFFVVVTVRAAVRQKARPILRKTDGYI